MKRIISVVFICLFIMFFNAVSAETGNEVTEDFYIKVNDKNVPARIKSIDVITATKSVTPKAELASSITVIAAEDIEEKKKATVIELLKDLPGIDIVQTGGMASVFIRGARSEHTLVMIDGIEMNDPMEPGRSYNLSNLTLENVEQIEIVKGPQSTLYGSDAMGGVINIITKKGAGKRFSLFSEAGSFKTFREGFEVGGGNDKLSYSLGVTQIDTEGISSAAKKYGNNEKDGYHNTSLSSRFTFTPKEKISTDLVFKYLVSKFGLDGYNYSIGLPEDDPNYTGENKELYLGLQCGVPGFVKAGDQRIGVSFSRHNRDYNNDKDVDHPDDLMCNTFSSQIRKINWQHSLAANKINNFMIGLDYGEEMGKSYYYSESAFGPFVSDFPEKKARNRGYFLQDQVNVNDKIFAVVGARLDNHDRFGSKVTYRVAPGYNIAGTNTKLKASYATGFKAPSLYQLYSTEDYGGGPIGDPDLKPDESKSYDLGIEQSFLENKVYFDFTYFHSDYKNMVDYDLVTSKYRNIAKALTEGVELNSSLKLKDDFTLKATAAKLRAKDRTNGENLVRRPKNKYSLGMDYHFVKDGIFSIDAVYTGKRDDINLGQRIILDSYTLVNITTSYGISKNLEIYARADNIFNKDYEEAKGYGTPGSSFYGGVKLNY
ncbi:MAG: TonB-dependent receptor [bacterium]|nr:TonB-dependent receptor [bacterium]